VSLHDVDRICVVVGRTRHKMVQAEILEAGKRGARLIELRLDFLSKAPDFKRLLTDKPCPMVATVRRPADGGRWGGSEEERRMLLRQAVVAGFDWVDLETDIAEVIPRFGKVRRIVSYHNMRETPADLEKIHARMCKQDADVVKLAVKAQNPADNLRVLALMQNPARPTVAIAMGDFGFCTRILAAKYGAPFTYAAFNKERGIAPGLPSFTELQQVYQYDKIDADTQVFGVLGDPVAHSLSPLIHNTAFRQIGLNAVYLPFRVPPADVATFLKEFDRIPVKGYSVTIPHKETVVAAAKTQDDAVAETKAANTLVRGPDGLHAYNTDYQGVLEALKTNLAEPGPPAAKTSREHGNVEAPQEQPMQVHGTSPLRDKAVLVLGAGGVAHAVAHALHREGALVTIANRTAERGHKLAEEVGCRTMDWAARHTVICDILVNCTSVGMHPNVDALPVHPSFLKTGLTVFDTVYTPETTLLIKEARDRGCRVVTGVDLFVRQAALQFQLFTGQAAPLEAMRKVVKRALSPVTIREEEEEQ
jgi:3-dehydroquinate dehydratase / shikimate dehydrogenase